MNIEEARKVYWLKNNHKTLGELLDEGFLTQPRLEWAAEKAYDPLLKEAAQVLLSSQKKISGKEVNQQPSIHNKHSEKEIEIGIPIEKARSTPWPFAPNKGQLMGALVDAKQLTLKDLGFAIETAWDEKVKQAAIALSLVRLKQTVKEPIPSAGFVHVVPGGRSYSERRESFLTLLQGMLFGFLIALSIYFLFPSLRGLEKSANSPTFSEFIAQPNGVLSLAIGISILALLGLLSNLAIDQINKRISKQIDAYHLGQEGEDNVVQVIAQALDGNWHLFRNISLPGRNKADLDIVLVGPPGVWVLEVKNFNGIYRNRGEFWEYQKNKGWKAISKSPSRQANNASLRLGNFLKADRLNTFVHPVVVWASSASPLEIENPTVAIWKLSHLADELGNIWQGEKLPLVERTKIVEKLTRLCDDQKNKEKL